MTLNEYQQHALETAIYPENRRIIYPTLGLTGEAGDNTVHRVWEVRYH